MSLLELFGLEKIFDDYLGGDSGVTIGGIIWVVGVVAWLVLAFANASILDQGAVFFNLISFIGLIIITLIKFKEAKEEEQLNKVFFIVSLLVIIISFIIGTSKGYHSLLYRYEYNTIGSGFAYTFIPTIIINMLFPFFCRDKHDKVGTKIKKSFGTIGMTLLVIITFFFIGQFVTVIIYFSGHRDLYLKAMTYHDTNFATIREEYSDKSLNETISSLYSIANDNTNAYCENSGLTDNESCQKYKNDNYKKILDGVTKKYGYTIINSIKVDDNSIAIMVRDWEYQGIVSYYILNTNNFAISPISESDYNGYKN